MLVRIYFYRRLDILEESGVSKVIWSLVIQFGLCFFCRRCKFRRSCWNWAELFASFFGRIFTRCLVHNDIRCWSSSVLMIRGEVMSVLIQWEGISCQTSKWQHSQLRDCLAVSFSWCPYICSRYTIVNSSLNYRNYVCICNLIHIVLFIYLS